MGTGVFVCGAKASRLLRLLRVAPWRAPEKNCLCSEEELRYCLHMLCKGGQAWPFACAYRFALAFDPPPPHPSRRQRERVSRGLPPTKEQLEHSILTVDTFRQCHQLDDAVLANMLNRVISRDAEYPVSEIPTYVNRQKG